KEGKWRRNPARSHGRGEEPVAPDDTKGRQRCSEFLLRAPFSRQKSHLLSLAEQGKIQSMLKKPRKNLNSRAYGLD
ncbi:MAG: hypothetical protein ABIP20_06325, partial [Chthoniobacteraceae bacterium]